MSWLSAAEFPAAQLARRQPSHQFIMLAGGLMSFGFDFPHLFYRAAYYVDRIFKGATPTELPIQQPTKFQLVLNLATARLLGFAMPTSILLRADEVIE